MTECFLKLWLGSAETLAGLLYQLAVNAVELQREQARAVLGSVKNLGQRLPVPG
jgi:hypothetical protein